MLDQNVLLSSKIAESFDYQYLWKEIVSILDFFS